MTSSTAWPATASNDWMTIGDVASMLKISERTVQRLISPDAGKDRLMAARFGNTTRIRRTTLEKYLVARERDVQFTRNTVAAR